MDNLAIDWILLNFPLAFIVLSIICTLIKIRDQKAITNNQFRKQIKQTAKDKFNLDIK
jgi:hypothetical protein